MLRQGFILLAIFDCLAGLSGRPARADELPPPRPVEAPPPFVFDRPAAVLWAMEHNPTLAPIRQQRGIAEAGTVIAHTYPFNPFWQNYTAATNGPAAAGITNRVAVNTMVRLDVELRHQGKYRQATAQATLSRTDWEIAFQELQVAVRVLRAFNAVRYRQEKLHLIDEITRLNEGAVEQFRRLADQGRLPRADLILAQVDVADSRAARAPAQAALDVAWQMLRRELGAVDECIDVAGPLELPPPVCDPGLTQLALETRADLRARQAAVVEAEGRLKLEIANRFGNPSVGPWYERNETSVNFIGSWLWTPLPVLNVRRGEIAMRKAERDQALLFVRQSEVTIEQDVQAALVRLRDAQQWAQSLRDQVLPELRKTLEELERLFAAGEPGADVPRLMAVRLRLLRARDLNLDALWELTQAEADLAAAVGDPRFAAFPQGQVPEPPADEPCKSP